MKFVCNLNILFYRVVGKKIVLKNLPITDTPLILTLGNFVETE